MSGTAQQQGVTDDDVDVDRAVGRLVLGWGLVGVPLAYGVVQTLSRTVALFTG